MPLVQSIGSTVPLPHPGKLFAAADFANAKAIGAIFANATASLTSHS